MKKWIFLSALLFATAVPASAASTIFGVVGDGGMNTRNQEAVVDSLVRAKVTELVLPGDNLYNPLQSYGSVWDPWKAKGLRFPLVAIGNHNGGYGREMKYFGMPGEFYAKTNGVSRFVVLNSDNERNVQDQIRFLDTELARATEPNVFVVFHHPTFTVSERHHWREREDFQNGIRVVLRKHRDRITALLVGHDHIATLVDIDGIPMIVSGAVHESIPTRPVAFRDGPFSVQTRWLFRDGPFWVRLEINQKNGEAIVDFVDARKNVSACKARLFPRPIALDPTCIKTTSRERPVRKAPPSYQDDD